jgi:hypothetical protein
LRLSAVIATLLSWLLLIKKKKEVKETNFFNHFSINFEIPWSFSEPNIFRFIDSQTDYTKKYEEHEQS